MLSLEDRSDPVALLGSLINAGVANRLTVVFDGARRRGADVYVAGGRAADAAQHPELRAEIAAHPRPRATWRADAAQTMSWTNSPSWVRLRHSTIGTISP